MSKNLKRYNEQTKKWEPISAPDVSYIQNLCGDTVTDTNVVVTNYNYTEDGETGKTLSDTLTDISDDISRLQRNVSWLAEHGGGGGGGGGGGQVVGNYGISVVTPAGITNGGSVYTRGNETKIQVTFMITGGTEGDECYYSYQLDANQPEDFKKITVNREVTINIDLTGGTSKHHYLTISARNPYSMTIPSFGFHIYESSLSVVFDAETAGSNYANNIFNVLQNDTVGSIPLLVTNGLVGSNLSIVAHVDGYPDYPHPIQKCTTDRPTKMSLPLWKIISRDNVDTSNFYVVRISASATLGENTATQEDFEVRIRIINPSEITITVGVNGIGESEQATATLDDIANYNFKVYAPAEINYVYYAAKLTFNGTDTRIEGSYYDDGLCEPGTTYVNNNTTPTEAVVYKKFSVPSTLYSAGDYVTLSVKAWDVTGTRVTATTRTVLIEEPSTDKFPRQYFSREDGSPKDTMFASWNETNANATSKNSWKSDIDNYYFLDSGLHGTENKKVNLSLDLYNGNDRSGIQTDTTTAHFRLQNHAYATVDFSRYAAELFAMQSRSEGFTISLTVNIDKTTDTNHTVFLWGTNNPDGTLLNGIRVDVDKVYWAFWENLGTSSRKHELPCNISTGERTTIDFAYEYNATGSNVKIFVDGVMNAALTIRALSGDYPFPNTAYFGCDLVAGNRTRYSDFDLYEFSIYTKVLSDLYTVVNSKNARLEGSISDPAVLADYNDWKKRNFIEADEDDPTKPVSIFYDNDGVFSREAVIDISRKSSIPTMYLSFQGGQTQNFDKDYFYAKHSKEDSGGKFDATAVYYDPDTNQGTETMNVKAQLQGTTTLGYRVKNLEIIMDDTVVIDGITVPVLFQPKKEWFPEKQFTLKADVVDSSHANNAVIGEWINNCGLLENNPAMQAFTEANRPLDVDNSGNTRSHITDGVEKTVDEDVQIRHTLEGFPILLFISFAGSDYYDFIGIYSFNLGRYSYYNMGMKFLQCFSRRNAAGDRMTCPWVIKYYKEKPTLGSINSATDVFSFEFGNAGNLQVAEYPVWSQYNPNVVHSYGEFKYPEVVSDSDEIWDKLCALFRATATTPVSYYNRDAVDTFSDIYPYTVDLQGHYTRTSDTPIDQSIDNLSDLQRRINFHNAAAYYVIANAFGMSDSLGKNMVLRTWDGGNSWWTAFYDMDTALALENNGAEDNPVTMAVDHIYTNTNELTQQTTTGITYHDENSRYAAYRSKLWGLLRDDYVLYNMDGGGASLRDNQRLYEDIWSQARQRTGVLSTSDKFVDMMKAKVDRCGEVIYNFDYRSKYILDTYEQDEINGVYPAINFLHGTRVGFVRDWLKKHFYFLDGLFDASRFSALNTRIYDDSPYYNQKFNMSVMFPGSMLNVMFRVQVTTPTFVSITFGSDDRLTTRFYVEKENTETKVYVPNNASQGSQMTISSASLITIFNGLNDGFQNIMDGNAPGVVRSMVEFTGGPSNKLSNVDPFKPQPFILQGESSLEKLDLSNTTWPIKLGSYKVDLSGFSRLIWVNISNSHVTSITLPPSSLDYLNVSNTDITELTVMNQNKLTDVSLSGCTKLNTVKFDSCDSLTAITVSDKRNLTTLEIVNCQSVSAITISECPNLQRITIRNNRGLKTLSITNTTEYGIDCDISIIACEGLETFRFHGSTSTSPIVIDEATAETIKTLSLYACTQFAGIQYNGDSGIEQYHNHYVLDLSRMESLENASFTSVSTLKYIRTNNDINGSPVRIDATALQGTDLERIFGYIEIASEGVFDEKWNFYLNDLGMKDTLGGGQYEYGVWNDSPVNPEDGFFVGDYVLNVKITSTSLGHLMRNTNANIGDVYYLLSLCDSSVTNYSFMFKDCKNIVQDAETAKQDHTFCGLDKNLFKYCTNILDASHMFDGCEYLEGAVPVEVMQAVTKKITMFSYVFPSGMIYDNYSRLFAENNNITIIEGFNPIFTNQHMDDVLETGEFWERYAQESEKLLDGLDNIVEINDSFNGSQIWLSVEHTGKLLSGKTSLTKIARSFNGIWDGEPRGVIRNLICDPNNLSAYSNRLQLIDNSFNFSESDATLMTLMYGDGFFASCRNSIETIANSFGGGINKAIDSSDCQYGGFPYRIFEGMTRVKNIVGFFEGINLLANPHLVDDGFGGEYIDGDPLDITLPSYVSGNTRYDMFGTNTSLVNVSACFRKMMHGSYTLVGDGFRNNKIENVDALFDEYDNNLDDRYSADNKTLRKGMIPYHLFYQQNGNTISSMTEVFQSTTSTAVTYYTMDTSSNDIMDYLEEDGGNYVWNIYLHDGTRAFADKIAYFHTHIADVRSAHPELFDGNDPLYPDNVVPNELMDYLNEAHDSTTFDETILGDRYETTAKQDIFSVQNYFCPPDIFRYCENLTTTDITGVFRQASNGVQNGTSLNPKVAGYFGKCPPMLFRPLSNIAALNYVFEGFSVMLPYSWKNGAVLFPPTLFTPLTGVRFMEGTFIGTTIWGGLSGDPMMVQDVFDTFGQSITKASRIWDNANWIGNSTIPSTLFSSCSRLEDISGMFSRSGPATVYQSMFIASQGTLVNVSNFMDRNGRSLGTVPDFWNGYTKIRYTSRAYYGVNTNLTNYDQIQAHPAYVNE